MLKNPFAEMRNRLWLPCIENSRNKLFWASFCLLTENRWRVCSTRRTWKVQNVYYKYSIFMKTWRAMTITVPFGIRILMEINVILNSNWKIYWVFGVNMFPITFLYFGNNCIFCDLKIELGIHQTLLNLLLSQHIKQ